MLTQNWTNMRLLGVYDVSSLCHHMVGYEPVLEQKPNGFANVAWYTIPERQCILVYKHSNTAAQELPDCSV